MQNLLSDNFQDGSVPLLSRKGWTNAGLHFFYWEQSWVEALAWLWKDCFLLGRLHSFLSWVSLSSPLSFFKGMPILWRYYILGLQSFHLKFPSLIGVFLPAMLSLRGRRRRRRCCHQITVFKGKEHWKTIVNYLFLFLVLFVSSLPPNIVIISTVGFLFIPVCSRL